MPIKEDAFTQVGPLSLVGPAVERDRKIMEDNDFKQVDVAEWMGFVHDQRDAMEASEVEFFKTLRSKST